LNNGGVRFMKVLVIGSGAREHALVWAIAASPVLSRLYCAPGNAGIGELAECVALDAGDHAAVARFCTDNKVEFVVIGPEAPLVAGLADDLAVAGIKVFGPSKAAARLEGSKGFAKDLCRALSIPTASYRRFSDKAAAKAYAAAQRPPIVVKADGLAAGKGVTIAETTESAFAAIDACLKEAGDQIVIEEHLAGEEASFFALVDGTHVLPLAAAQDHKRAFDGETGPNTGGMGAYSPAPVMTAEMMRRTMEEIVTPTVQEMARRGTPYKGLLYAGLMITESGPKLIEYNVRFGDPECQVLMLRLKSDLLPALLAATDGVLKTFDLRWRDEAALAVVMASRGYPGEHVKNTEIRGLDAARAVEGVEIFQAGTRRDGERLLATAGRTLSITALGKTVSEAQRRAYQAASAIDWPEGFYRTDIGWRAIAREAKGPIMSYQGLGRP
jgi:phosphoribosylamine--glycine ligase